MVDLNLNLPIISLKVNNPNIAINRDCQNGFKKHNQIIWYLKAILNIMIYVS